MGGHAQGGRGQGQGRPPSRPHSHRNHPPAFRSRQTTIARLMRVAGAAGAERGVPEEMMSGPPGGPQRAPRGVEGRLGEKPADLRGMEGKWGNEIGQFRGLSGWGPPDGPGAPATQGSIPGVQLGHEPGGPWRGGSARLQGGVQGKRPWGVPGGQKQSGDTLGVAGGSRGSKRSLSTAARETDGFLTTKALGWGTGGDPGVPRHSLSQGSAKGKRPQQMLERGRAPAEGILEDRERLRPGASRP